MAPGGRGKKSTPQKGQSKSGKGSAQKTPRGGDQTTGIRSSSPPSPLDPVGHPLAQGDETDRTGPYWEALRNRIEDAILRAHNGDDRELETTTRGAFESLQEVYDGEEHEEEDDDDDSEPDDDDASVASDSSQARARQIRYLRNVQRAGVELAARFMDEVAPDHRPSARLALLYLARADYEYARAVENFFTAVEVGDDDELNADAANEQLRIDSEASGSSPDQAQQSTAPAAGAGAAGASGQAAPNAKKEKMARDNPNVDREPAELNNVDPSKLTIRLSQGPGRVAKTFTSSYTAATMRWDNNQDIRNLNRWRSQVFLRTMGPKQAYRVHFHATETSFLIETVRRLRLQRLAEDPSARFTTSELDFRAITAAFNAQFVGTTNLSGTGGVPRPLRTLGAIRTEMARLPEITAWTGMAPKDQGVEPRAQDKVPPARGQKGGGVAAAKKKAAAAAAAAGGGNTTTTTTNTATTTTNTTAGAGAGAGAVAGAGVVIPPGAAGNIRVTTPGGTVTHFGRVTRSGNSIRRLRPDPSTPVTGTTTGTSLNPNGKRSSEEDEEEDSNGNGNGNGKGKGKGSKRGKGSSSQGGLGGRKGGRGGRKGGGGGHGGGNGRGGKYGRGNGRGGGQGGASAVAV